MRCESDGTSPCRGAESALHFRDQVPDVECLCNAAGVSCTNQRESSISSLKRAGCGYPRSEEL